MSQQMKISEVNLFRGLGGELQLVLNMDGRQCEHVEMTVLNVKEKLKEGKEVGVVIEQIKKRRSLDANAYFHVLCSKIAEKTRLSMDEVKNNLVLNYGTPTYQISIPSEARISDIWAYARYIGEEGNKSQYLLYKQTHTLTTAEMARLIDGTIAEAQQLEIETATPQELELMQLNWESTHRYKEAK